MLVLASGSPYRRALIARLVPGALAVDHRVDERAVQSELATASPDAIAERLAEAKAASLAETYPEAWILGSDQVVDHAGEILGKPGTPAAAEAQLRSLAGQTHRLVTAVALRDPTGHWHRHTDVHLMTLRSLDDETIARYVAADAPLDCCGSYRIEARGVTLFDEARGNDPTAIEGLPLIAVARLLREAGFPES
ncbi:MAG: septum formation protein Maf [Sandaracinus sp.]|nr:septum formation protein Maf [Sandaracinus sp.]